MSSEMPSGWTGANLGQVVGRPRAKAAPSAYPELPFVGMDSIAPGGMDLLSVGRFGDMKSAGGVFEPGDVLYGRMRPYLNKVHLAKQRGACSAEFIVMPPGTSIRGDFLAYLVHQRAFVNFASEQSSGDRPRVDFEGLASFEFGLPPKAEQQRIVSRIEELFSEIDEGERALERVGQLVERYRQSVLKAAVTGELVAGTSPEHWGQAQLGDLCSLITSGSRGWSEFYADDGPLFIRAQNLKHDVLDLDDIAHVNLEGVREGLRTRVAKGDLLVTITGANVTKTAHVDVEIAEAYVSQHVALVRLRETALARYLFYWLISPANGRAKLLEAAYGAGKPGLSLTDLRELVVPVPPTDECARIAEYLDVELSRLQGIGAQKQSSGAAAAALRQSILKAAFSGQLVPQDPNDEPASALLARLAARAASTPAEPKRRGRPAGRRLSQPNPEAAD